MTLRLRPLSPAIGSEIEGLDLARPIKREDRHQLQEAFDKRHLLVLRNQDLSYAEQRRLVEVFGTVADEHLDGSQVAFVSNRRADGIVPEGRLLWHSDFTFTPWPVETICLYGIEVTGQVSPTRFASTERAWSSLEDGLKQRVADLSAWHLADFSPGAALFDLAESIDLPEDHGLYPRQLQPIRRLHPRTGRPLLFVNEWFTIKIDGLPTEEGRQLRSELFAQLYDKAYVYEHHWQQHDLVIWDNLVCQHSRDVPASSEGGSAGARTLRRLIISDGYGQMIETIPSLKASMVDRRQESVTKGELNRT